MHVRSDGGVGVGRESKTFYVSPFRLLLLVGVSIFVTEGAIMFLISRFPRITPTIEGILDAFLLLLFVFPLLYVFFYRPFRLEIKERQKAETEKDATIFNLEKAIDKIKLLEGIIPICAKCKKVRDDAGYWQQVEVYIRDRSEAEFSHGICPACAMQLYPGL